MYPTINKIIAGVIIQEREVIESHIETQFTFYYVLRD